jgi:hypothetical protein
MQAWADVAHLRHSNDFRTLLTGSRKHKRLWPCGLLWPSVAVTMLCHCVAELETDGGRAVALLLARAARLPSGDMAAEICVDACWEKLHTGSWAEVPLHP